MLHLPNPTNLASAALFVASIPAIVPYRYSGMIPA
jgi:hypothetical protein